MATHYASFVFHWGFWTLVNDLSYLPVYMIARLQNTSQGGASLSSKVRPPSMKKVQPIWSQPPAWQRRWKQSPMLSDGLPRQVTDRSRMRSSSQIQLSCYKKWKVKWGAQTGKCQFSTSTFETSCGCTALDMTDWRGITEQMDWRAKHPSQMAWASEYLKCWGAWDTTCGHNV